MAKKKKDGELNPDHPATKAVRDLWYKIVALMMHQAGQRELIIRPESIDAFAADPASEAVAIQFKDGTGIILRLVDLKTAEEMAKREGGVVEL